MVPGVILALALSPKIPENCFREMTFSLTFPSLSACRCHGLKARRP